MTAAREAQAHGWQAELLAAGRISLQAWHPNHFAGQVLTVYIEGDGFAWRTPRHPSSDPTPIDPMALRLALAHPSSQVAYLARPCQYVGTQACTTRDWTGGRFSEELVAASDLALTSLKHQADAETLILVGYSGGGAVASLLAARRNDVIRLVTVAGNLDHRAWTEAHGIDPLSASLNPADQIDRLNHIPQLHFVGGRDEIVPVAVIDAFTERFAPNHRPKVIIEPEFDHHCCWAESWPRLARKAGLISQ